MARQPAPRIDPRDPALRPVKDFLDWLYTTVPGLARAWLTIKRVTGASYTLVAGDDGLYLRTTSASAVAITVPPRSTVQFADGAVIHLRNAGAGQITVVEGTGVTVNTAATLKARVQHSSIMLVHIEDDEWDILGDLEP